MSSIALSLVLTCVNYADQTVKDTVEWPENWPKELESLRNVAKSYSGEYQIPFSSRDAFEAAWPHILKIKGKNAKLVLRRGPISYLEKIDAAGVHMHTEADKQNKWVHLNLITDGDIVDLNRIELPSDTTIMDLRFKAKSPYGDWGPMMNGKQFWSEGD